VGLLARSATQGDCCQDGASHSPSRGRQRHPRGSSARRDQTMPAEHPRRGRGAAPRSASCCHPHRRSPSGRRSSRSPSGQRSPGDGRKRGPAQSIQHGGGGQDTLFVLPAGDREDVQLTTVAAGKPPRAPAQPAVIQPAVIAHAAPATLLQGPADNDGKRDQGGKRDEAEKPLSTESLLMDLLAAPSSPPGDGSTHTHTKSPTLSSHLLFLALSTHAFLAGLSLGTQPTPRVSFRFFFFFFFFFSFSLFLINQIRIHPPSLPSRRRCNC
jgi:hypothetical protein